MDSSKKKKRLMRRRSGKINIPANRPKTGKGGVREAHPKTAEQYFAKGKRFRTAWDRVTEALTKMRAKGFSLRRAAGEVGTSPRTVLRLGKSALRKNQRGRFVAKRTDTRLSILVVPSVNGPVEVAVRDSRQATLLSQYWTSVHTFLETGETEDLSKFEGQFIRDAAGTKIGLLTDLNQLKRLGSAGILSFHSIYAERQ